MSLKKLFLSLLVVLSGFLLYACAGEIEFSINGVKGYEAKIDGENRSITIEVSDAISTFDKTAIELPENIRVDVYEDETRENIIAGNLLTLDYGINVFYLRLVYLEDESITDDWKLSITRDEKVKVTLVSISIKELKKNYKLNDEFEEGILTLNYSDNSTKDIPITSSMVSGFDTTMAGEKVLTIKYEDKFTTYKIVVDKTLVAIEVIEWQKDYFIGDIFKNGKLRLKFDDNSTADIILTETMVSGFDTTTAGDKKLIVSYEDKTTEIDYVVKKPVAKLVAIEVIELKNEYYLNDKFENGKLLLTYDDETTKEIILTEAMVSGFDTTTAGKKVLTITYQDKNVTFNYEVIGIQIETIEILKIQKHYWQNDEFENGLLVINYTNNTSEEVDLTLDMVKGFTTATSGWKDITITYNGLEIKERILVQAKAYDGYEMPEPTKLEVTKVKELMCQLNALAYVLTNGKDSYEYAYQESFDTFYNIEADAMEIFQKAGFTEEQLDKLLNITNTILKDNAFKLEKITSFHDLVSRLEKEPQIISDLQKALAEILEIITTDQIAMILCELGSVGGYGSIHIYFDYINEAIEYNEFYNSDLIAFLRENNLGIVADFLETISSQKINEMEISYGEFYHFVDFAKQIIYSIINLDNDTILGLMKVIGEFVVKMENEQVTYSEINLVEKIKAVTTWLRQLVIETDNFAGLDEILDIYLTSINTTIQVKNEMEYSFKIIKFAFRNIEFILDLIDSLVENEVDYLVEFFKMMSSSSGAPTEDALKGMLVVIKKLDELFVYLDNNNLENDLIKILEEANIATKLGYTAFVSEVASAANYNYDQLKITPDGEPNEEAKNVYNVFSKIMSGSDENLLYFRYDASYPMLFEKGITLEEFKERIINNLYMNDGTPLQPSDIEIEGFINDKVGIHRIKISYGTKSVYANYLIYDENTEFNIQSFHFERKENSWLYYIEKGNNIPTYMIDKRRAVESYHNNWEMQVEEYRNDLIVGLSIYLPEYKLVFWLNDIQIDNIIFEVETDTTGFKFGHITANVYGLDIYLPIQYYVYEKENPNIEIEIQNLPVNDIYIVPNEWDEEYRNYISGNIRIDYFLENINFNEEIIISAFKDDGTRYQAGDKFIYQIILYDKYEISLNIEFISEESANEFYALEFESPLYIEEGSEEIDFTNLNLRGRIYFKNMGEHYFENLDDLNRVLKDNKYQEEAKFTTNNISEFDYQDYATAKITVSCGSTSITTEVRVKQLSKEEYNRCWYNLRWKSENDRYIVVDNLDLSDDAIIDLLVERIPEIYIDYEYLNKDIYIKGEKEIREFFNNVTFEKYKNQLGLQIDIIMGNQHVSELYLVHSEYQNVIRDIHLNFQREVLIYDGNNESLRRFFLEAELRIEYYGRTEILTGEELITYLSDPDNVEFRFNGEYLDWTLYFKDINGHISAHSSGIQTILASHDDKLELYVINNILPPYETEEELKQYIYDNIQDVIVYHSAKYGSYKIQKPSIDAFDIEIIKESEFEIIVEITYLFAKGEMTFYKK